MDELELPDCETLILRREGWRVHVTLNRPAMRNAINARMIDELLTVVERVRDRRDVRALILRGAGGSFCVGGDVEDMAAARAATAGPDGLDPLAVFSRRFGRLLQELDHAPQVVVTVLEGAVMGGGLGLACVADVGLAHQDALFRLPETSLGIPPAQIAPFVVRAIGLTQARRLALTGERIDGARAVALGLAHESFEDEADLAGRLAAVLEAIGRGAPGAIATTKALMLAVGERPLAALLDDAAQTFATAVRGREGAEGMSAFLRKARPPWVDA